MESPCRRIRRDRAMKQRICKAALVFLASIFFLLDFSPAMAREKSLMPATIDGEKRPCLDCHRYPNVYTNAGALACQALCLECHGKSECVRPIDKTKLSLQVKPESVEKGRHRYVACIQCHRDVARSPHVSQSGALCSECHPVHGEGGAVGGPHLRISCQACHFSSDLFTLDTKTDRIILASVDSKGTPLSRTDHTLRNTKNEEFCIKCHFPENKVGAAASVLPPKSVLCILCHNAALDMGGPLFWVAFLIFIAGILLMVRMWFKGSVEGEETSLHRKIARSSDSVWGTIFSKEFFPLLKTFVLDIILQRRILKESVRRWSIHSLIYLSILTRFSLSVFTFFVYRIGPESAIAEALINKNNGFTAFVNDLLGLFILAGILWTIIQRLFVKPPHVLTEFRDGFAVGLIGVLVFLGFILEGARILMTQVPAEISIYSFMGHMTAGVLSVMSVNWSSAYVVLWYAHAIAGALLVAYLPYGKMKHIFNTPLTLLLNYKMK